MIAHRLWLLLTLILLFVGVSGTPSIHARETLSVVVAVPRNFPPHYQQDKNNRVQGFAIDAMEEVARLADLEVRYFVVDTWEDVLQTVLNDQADIIPNLGITPQRQAWFDFTESIETVRVRIFARAGEHEISHLSDLKNRNVAVVKTNVAGDILTREMEITPKTYIDPEAALFALLSGQVDAFVYPESALRALARQAKVENRIMAVGEPLKEIRRAMAVRKGNVVLLARLDPAVKDFLASKRYSDIYAKWYGKAQPYWTPRKVALFIGLPLLLALAAMFVWRYRSLAQLNVRLQENIEERQRAEGALRASEGKYRQIVVTANEGIWMVDEDNITTYVNRKMADLLGHTVGEMLGSPLFRFIDDQDPTAQEMRLKHGRAENADQYELKFLRKDDQPIWTQVQASPLQSSAGEYAGALYMISDITDRKTAEQKLRESEERYKLAIEGTGYSVWDYDLATAKVYLDESMLRSLGYEPGEIDFNFTWWWDGVHPDSRPIIEKSNQDYLQGKQKWVEAEYQFRTKSGEWKWISSRGKGSQFNDKGKPVRFTGINWDITDQKKASQELFETQAKLQAVLEFSPALISIKDLEGKYLLLGRNFELLDTPRPDELLGKTVAEIVSHDLADTVSQADAAALSAGGPVELELELTHKDGSRHTYLDTKFPLYGSDGQPFGIGTIGTDITERKRAEEEKKKTDSRLRQSQKMEALGTFTSGIAHDFNNILTAILGNSELALEGVDEQSELGEYLQEILKASQRAQSLVRQILIFTRRGDQTFQPIALAPLVKEALNLVRASVPSTIEIRSRLEAENDAILGDSTQIHQIILNLCSNAAHAIGDQNGTIEVRLEDVLMDEMAPGDGGTERLPGRYLKLSVSDTGRGIPPEIRDKIFDPYFTTKQTGEGTGLGLAVVHGIIKNHGGSISVYSEPGQGTTINVYFKQSTEAPKEQRREAAPIQPGSGRILLVDDEVSIVRFLKSALERLGYEVEDHTNSSDVLAALKDHPKAYDLLITDQTMPRMTGMDLAVEALKIRPELPIILCTGHGQATTAEKAEAVGIKAVLPKPVSIHEIAEVVARLLETKAR